MLANLEPIRKLPFQLSRRAAGLLFSPFTIDGVYHIVSSSCGARASSFLMLMGSYLASYKLFRPENEQNEIKIWEAYVLSQFYGNATDETSAPELQCQTSSSSILSSTNLQTKFIPTKMPTLAIQLLWQTPNTKQSGVMRPPTTLIYYYGSVPGLLIKLSHRLTDLAAETRV